MKGQVGGDFTGMLLILILLMVVAGVGGLVAWKMKLFGLGGDDDSDDNPPNIESSPRPLRPRRRLGLPTRRRRSSLGATNLEGPSRRRPRIQQEDNRSEVEIDVGTKVKSPGTRWQLPANTIYHGEVVKKSMFRGAVRFEVKW